MRFIVSEEIKNENRRRVAFPIGRPWGHHKVKYILGNFPRNVLVPLERQRMIE